jgi:hypothetical protein
VALCKARISVQPLWPGFSSSNPHHSQSRAEQRNKELPRKHKLLALVETTISGRVLTKREMKRKEKEKQKENVQETLASQVA